MTRSIVVIGAGAAGCMAAIFAAQQGARVLLLERMKDGGRKILISGGGRCNVLPSQLSPSQYFTTSSPNTLKKMLLSWPLAEQRRFFEQTLNIPLKLEAESGKLFPVSDKARDVRDGLVDYAKQCGVRFQHNAYVMGLRSAGAGWRVQIEGGTEIEADRVIVATGGLSVPATGSDGTGLRILRKLGYTIHEVYPALTPLTCAPPRHGELAGISLEVTLQADHLQARGGFLFTHRGYSGPSVLNVSHVAVQSRMHGGERAVIRTQWTARSADEWRKQLSAKGSATVGTIVKRELPARLADALLDEAQVDAQVTTSQLKKDERQRLVQVLTEYALPWTGDEGYKKAEVTGGGVALAEVDPKTMESKRHSGLYLCGEVLDAFGPIGGYNFAWGWATGRAAGLGAARSD
ncbi:MAG TPA: aminoacetone oxidase family FAD-binding enzyme [Longimicrobiales bacterium]|nr:aminoacetone oxidase family FAD-binding enzyme [Longimicrobiales bacterium]